jgi:N-acetylmuramoyl-L-alanine amidase
VRCRLFPAIFLALCGPAAAVEVVVDVGHFLEEPGATSARGRPEFEFNRVLAADVARAIERRGASVKLVGADGSMRQLMGRVQAARGAKLLLSVHHDSVQPHFLETWNHDGVERLFSDRYAGFSLFVSRKNPEVEKSLACAAAIGAALRASGFRPSLYHAERIPGEMKPFADRRNGVHYYDNLVVLRHAAGPAVLLEAGVIVNRAEEQTVAEAGTRAKIAAAVASGLGACLEGR